MSQNGSEPKAAWSLFPSIQSTVATMNIHNISGRCISSAPHTTSHPSSITTNEDQGMAHSPKNVPLYKPSFLAVGKIPIDTRSLPPKFQENSTRPPQVGDELPTNFSFPGRTSSKQQDESQKRQEMRDNTPNLSSSVQSPTSIHTRSASPDSFKTNATPYSLSLPALQQKGLDDQPEPLTGEDIDSESFDLVAPHECGLKQYSIETRSEQLFSTEHLRIIFDDPSLLLRFTSYLSRNRPTSIPILIYYLDAIKALKALSYSNAIAEALEPLHGFDFTLKAAKPSTNSDLEVKANLAFDALVREDLPAYITHTYIQTVSLYIQRRITGTLPAHLREASDGLAEVFCLTDPSRPDNPIVFASEEFNRTTQYGVSYVIGRNCRFLQGPKTNPFSVRRIREKIEAGVEHYEVFLNYRRDGSPFMNLLMIAPLCDSRGVIRYFIGAQVDVSGLVKECSDMESLTRLTKNASHAQSRQDDTEHELISPLKNEFEELSEMLNLQELDTVRRRGGRMHKESHEENQDTNSKNGNCNKPRLLISSFDPDGFRDASRASGKLSGIYENYLLVRAHPSLRVLFASASMRVPGMLQSPFMNRIGGSPRVRDELAQALVDGRAVTARVRWVSKTDVEGYNRWIHCTPLLGSNGAIGVWMIVIVNDEDQQATGRQFRQAPPVESPSGRRVPSTEGKGKVNAKDFGDTRMLDLANGRRGSMDGSVQSFYVATERSCSPYSLRID